MPKFSLPPLLDQVVRLSESGADETVIRAYVEKAAPAYRITGHEIVQLRDLGISQGVIMSLIEHSQSAGGSSGPEVVAQQPPSSQAQSPTPTDAPAAVASPEAVAEFREALSPYGSWLDVPSYGWCWQPTVVVVNPGWRPYCDNGDWLWSDSGWYWHSYYSWGWAPFHYGRWFSHENRGWLWCPDGVWGPSWVSWRNSATHCGWAPLPPGAHFAAGLGWTFHGARVGADFGFGLASAHFNFVAHDHFADRQVARHTLRGPEANTAFNHTTVINNYAVGAGNRVINHGIGRETIAAASHAPVREVAVRELPRGGGQATRPDRVSKIGNSEVVYRPDAQISVPRNTFVSTPADRVVRSTVASTPVAPSSPVFRSSVAHQPAVITGGVARQPSIPNSSLSYRNRSQSVAPNQNWNTAPVSRMAPAARAPAAVYGRPSAPVMSAPRLSAPSAGGPHRAASPSIARNVSPGGGSFQGSVSRGSSVSGSSHGGRR